MSASIQLFNYTVELEYSVNTIRNCNTERSFNQNCREMIKYLENNKAPQLVLALTDNDEIIDIWYHMDSSLKTYLDPPIKYKAIGDNSHEQTNKT